MYDKKGLICSLVKLHLTQVYAKWQIVREISRSIDREFLYF